jgi:hypothetical protein
LVFILVFLLPFVIFAAILVHFSQFGSLCREKSGNPEREWSRDNDDVIELKIEIPRLAFQKFTFQKSP